MNKPIAQGIVLYTLPSGKIRPAMIVQNWNGKASYPDGTVNLQVFLDGSNDDSRFGKDDASDEECVRGMAWRTSKHFSETPKIGHWHWPQTENAMSDEAREKLARVAYKAYGQTTDFKNFQGNPMPEFDALPEKIREAWKNAAQAARESP